jgi:hypothetical protein
VLTAKTLYTTHIKKEKIIMANRHDVIIWDDSECPVEKDDVC